MPSEEPAASRGRPGLAPPPPPRPLQWRRAARALRELVADPERTDRVFELLQAAGGDEGERLFQRALRDPEGLRLLAARPSLLATLSDLPALERLPEGSLGRAYARFMREEHIAAQGLVDAAAAAGGERELDPERRFFFDRLRDMHDLWHVLTGYGRDLAGEASVLAFTYGQTRSRGIGLLVLTAAWLGPRDGALRWQRYLWRAWRRGRRAGGLPIAPYEELLPLPLDAVRSRLGVEPPERAHPGGILRFGPEAGAATS